MAEKDLYLWAENTTYNSGAVTVIKYKTGTSRNLAGVCFKISVVSGNFPAVEDSGSTYQLSDCVDLAKQGTNFSGAAADIYSSAGNKWVLCSGNSSKNIITLAGTVGLTSSDTGTNVLAYLYGGEYTVDSILSASDSSAQSYTTKGWTYEVGNPNPNTGGGGVDSSTITLPNAGWNMISVPANATLTSSGSLSNAIYWFSGTTYVTSTFSPASTLEPYKGYWVKTNDADLEITINYESSFTAPTGTKDITIETAGWNMISVPAAATLTTTGSLSNAIYWFSGTTYVTSTFSPASTLEQFKGYWIKTNDANLVITINYV